MIREPNNMLPKYWAQSYEWTISSEYLIISIATKNLNFVDISITYLQLISSKAEFTLIHYNICLHHINYLQQQRNNKIFS